LAGSRRVRDLTLPRNGATDETKKLSERHGRLQTMTRDSPPQRTGRDAARNRVKHQTLDRKVITGIRLTTSHEQDVEGRWPACERESDEGRVKGEKVDMSRGGRVTQKNKSGGEELGEVSAALGRKTRIILTQDTEMEARKK